ncbi:MAG: hypothetical protein JNL61_02960 [Rhizobiaceae bacterium]|nr:hypothetical protein [Rhizobiaceae bacterium]
MTSLAAFRRWRYNGGTMIVITTPFEDGVIAAETGMSKDDNPHPKGTPAHSDWNAGFEAATDAHEATEGDDE